MVKNIKVFKIAPQNQANMAQYCIIHTANFRTISNNSQPTEIYTLAVSRQNI